MYISHSPPDPFFVDFKGRRFRRRQRGDTDGIQIPWGTLVEEIGTNDPGRSLIGVKRRKLEAGLISPAIRNEVPVGLHHGIDPLLARKAVQGEGQLILQLFSQESAYF